MKFRKLGGQSVFNGNRFVQDAVLVMREDDSVEALIPRREAGDDIETVNGILSPGFVNAHCHIELSHLKGAVSSGTGLVPFIKEVVTKRHVADEIKAAAMQSAMDELWRGGVAGVADICNTTDSLELKKSSALRWQSLVEVISVVDDTARDRILQANRIRESYRQSGLAAGLVPHAPYSVSAGTFKALNRETAGGLVSIHNQETAAEDHLFRKGSGPFLKFFAGIGHPSSPIQATGKSSLQTWLPHFTEGQTILLVHNTFTGEEDLVFAKEHAQKHGLGLIYCLCPNANQYIENTLPPVELLLEHGVRIVLGTDSYASNWQLSMWSEIEAIRKGFPSLPVETLLRWATRNGGEAMRWSDLGHFSKGAKPGVVAIREGGTVDRLV